MSGKKLKAPNHARRPSRPGPAPGPDRETFSVLILAAGKATRFKSERSKMVHQLAGRPLGEYLLRATRELQPQRTYMVIGHEAAEVRKTFTRPGLTFIEQKDQRGTGHALMVGRAEIESCPSANLLVLVGDAPLLRPQTLRALVEFHLASHAAATVLTTRLANPYGYGRIVRVGGEKGNCVRAIVEEKVATPAQRKIQEINSGIICFSRPLLLRHLDDLSDHNAQKEYLLTDLVQILNRCREKVVAFPVADAREVRGVNDRVELALMEKILRRQNVDALAREGVTVVDPDATYIDAGVLVGRDTVIEPGVSLLGVTRVGRACTLRPYSTIADSVLGDRVVVRPSCVITGCDVASDVTIGPFAHLRDGAVIEPNARIGNFVEVKNSRVGRESKASHLTYLGDATLGVRVNIGAGTVTCNYDGAKKNRTIIEDGVFIGSGTMLVAPVTISKGSYVGAGSTITKNVPPDSLAIGRAPQVNKDGWVKMRNQSGLPISITERRVGLVAVFDVAGPVTLGEPAQELGKRIRQSITDGYSRVLVNLAGVTYIDSSGIGELVGTLSRLRKTGGQLKMTGATTQVHHLFHVANLDRVLEIHPDENSAIDSFERPSQEASKT